MNTNIIFTNEDKNYIKERDIQEETILQQAALLKEGSTPVVLERAATINDGIISIDKAEYEKYLELHRYEIETISCFKFVPASGAASRMFEDLAKILSSLETKTQPKEDSEEYRNFLLFTQKIRKMPCYQHLKNSMANLNKNLEQMVDEQNWKDIIRYLLYSPGLNYSQMPKALIPFHHYNGKSHTALEEQLYEAVEYAKDNKNNCRLHFTVAPQHEESIKEHLGEVRQSIEKDGIRLLVEFSEQKPSTETIALDMENHLVKDEEGKIFFRPGGHGALLENLANLDADIVFIKNIDNVVPVSRREAMCLYKKILAGYLVFLRNQTFDYLQNLEKEEKAKNLLPEIIKFAQEKLNLSFSKKFHDFSLDKKRKILITLLNRPIRVCGMVKNEGEPGGGPFWVKDSQGRISLQIVEKSQIDLKIPKQKQIFESSTHFNPVDIVCVLKDYQGRKFDLNAFVDKNAVFISQKTYQGKDIKVLELPGLWNGAMAYWNTVFIEVPLFTFNPVKKITDLLRDTHQSE